MKETLHIKNFGPIKEVKLELGKVNVLIGDQGTGKSLIGKILCICRYFSYINGINSGGIEQAFREWGIAENIKMDIRIEYSNSDYKVYIYYEFQQSQQIGQDGDPYLHEYAELKTEINPISERFKKLQSELANITPSQSDQFGSGEEFWSPPAFFFKNTVAAVMDNPIFIPTERLLQSIFSLGKSSIQNINDSLFNQFSKLDRIQRKFNKLVEIEPLEVQYKNENGQGAFKIKNEDRIFKMDNAPSGYKTTIPIVLVLKYYTDILKKNKTFVIDEPENSLFPNTQKQLFNFLVSRITNYTNEKIGEKFDNMLLLTTHSPYTLTSLNNLMYAYKIGQEYKSEVVSVIPEKYWLNPQDVSAYMLYYDEKEGGCKEKNIIDTETQLIDAVQIDGVSDVLNNEFNKLMEIKLDA